MRDSRSPRRCCGPRIGCAELEITRRSYAYDDEIVEGGISLSVTPHERSTWPILRQGPPRYSAGSESNLFCCRIRVRALTTRRSRRDATSDYRFASSPSALASHKCGASHFRSKLRTDEQS